MHSGQALEPLGPIVVFPAALASLSFRVDQMLSRVSRIFISPSDLFRRITHVCRSTRSQKAHMVFISGCMISTTGLLLPRRDCMTGGDLSEVWLCRGRSRAKGFWIGKSAFGLSPFIYKRRDKVAGKF